jgi:ubiquinone/menaquinone biosynthesis C-methylase UbiE
MGLEKQGLKPTGTIGRVIGRLMNRFHTSIYVDYFKEKIVSDNCRILDIGCGGGKFLKHLAKKGDEFKLWGLDHSKEMIDLSSQLNKEVIKSGRLKLLTGSVAKIDIIDNSLDLVTAFETVQFWPNLGDAFSEIYRVLDREGEFLIINRFPKKGTKWWKKATLKSEADYMTKLEATGFKNIFIDLEFKRNWIVVKAFKP